MNDIFYIDGDGKEYSYSLLLESIDSKKYYFQNYTATGYFDFVINLLTAIFYDKDIILKDFSTANNLPPSKMVVEDHTLENIDLIEKLKRSTTRLAIKSSGTTGKPKNIFHPVSRFLKSTSSKKIFSKSTWLLTYNPAHSAGIQLLFQVLINNGTIIDGRNLDWKSFDFVLKKYNLDFIAATPTFYRMKMPFLSTYPFVKGVTLNGEKPHQQLIDKIKTSFPNARVRNIYGSTETGPLMSSDSTRFVIPDRLIKKIKIQDGELYVSSELVSQSVKKDDWYPTGDLVKIIDNNPLTVEFIDRKVRIINVGGHNVNPQEVEDLILSHSKIQNVVVYGRKHKILGHLVVADVKLFAGESLSERDLILYCKTHLQKYKVPRIINFVEEIKTSTTGKKTITKT